MNDLPEGWRRTTGRLRLRLDTLEDVIPPDLVEDFDLGRAFAPVPLQDWFRTVLERVEAMPAFQAVPMNPAVVALGAHREEVTVHVLLCSRASMDSLIGAERALGVHILSTPDADPFGEDSASAREYRVAMVCDRAEFLEHLSDLAQDDLNPERHLDEYLCAWLNTLFHEIEHVRLFVQNAALARPADIESLADAGDLANDIFDCSTGYGIRPLHIDGHAAWADDLDEAREMMEVCVEAEGAVLMGRVLHGACAPQSLVAALGVTTEVAGILSGQAARFCSEGGERPAAPG